MPSVAAPVAPFGVDLVRLGQRGKMTDGPGDDITVAVEVALALAGGAEDAGDVTRHRGLFG